MTENYKFIDDISSRPLMECGHVALFQRIFNDDGTIADTPVCLRCKCNEVIKESVDLVPRKARCAMCGKVVSSNMKLDGFRYRSNKQFDTYYCGCANGVLEGVMNKVKEGNVCTHD